MCCTSYIDYSDQVNRSLELWKEKLVVKRRILEKKLVSEKETGAKIRMRRSWLEQQTCTWEEILKTNTSACPGALASNTQDW